MDQRLSHRIKSDAKKSKLEESCGLYYNSIWPSDHEAVQNGKILDQSAQRLFYSFNGGDTHIGVVTALLAFTVTGHFKGPGDF